MSNPVYIRGAYDWWYHSRIEPFSEAKASNRRPEKQVLEKMGRRSSSKFGMGGLRSVVRKFLAGWVHGQHQSSGEYWIFSLFSVWILRLGAAASGDQNKCGPEGQSFSFRSQKRPRGQSAHLESRAEHVLLHDAVPAGEGSWAATWEANGYLWNNHQNNFCE